MSKRDCASESNEAAAGAPDKRRRFAIDQPQTSEVENVNVGANEEYTVGWICALDTEYVAAQVFLDEKHGRPEHTSPNDNNDYTLGRIGKHHVVIAVLPDGEYGISSAATVARDMLHSFPNVKIGLMVGIGGGSPSLRDIRLGDVVVCASRDGKASVLQYDFGKTIQNQRFKTTGFMNLPPMVLRAAMNGLKAEYEIEGHQLEENINRILKNKVRLQKRYKRPDSKSDRLYRSTALHPSDSNASCQTTCAMNSGDLIPRSERTEDSKTTIHYGLIASANQLMKDAAIRDSLADEMDVLCFEMEAAGLMNHFPCLVIRGICDYSDTHKNKEWQGYAAMVAAAYTRDLLLRVPPNKIEAERRIADVIADIQKDFVEMSGNVKDLLLHQNTQERRTVLEWLTSIDHAPQQSDYSSRRLAGTGQWFVKDASFQTWLSTEKQTLFCPGIPGAGKTLITSLVIDELQEKHQQDSRIGFAYIYCDFRRQKEQQIIDLVASLLKQLAERLYPLPEEVQSLYDRLAHLQKRPRLADISEALHSVCDKYSRVFIVLDALDECEATSGCRGRLLSEVFDLQEKKNINILATSRPLPDIEGTFIGSPTIEIRAREEDVHKYLAGNLNRLPSFVHQSLELQQTINDTISKAVNGMFLLATLHIDSLAQQPTVGHIKKALKSLPTGLHETYTHAMERIESQGANVRDLAKKVLSFVIYAERELSPVELQHAVAVEPGQTQLDQEFIPGIDLACSICAGLIAVDIESNVVRLVHYTTQEFFNTTKDRWFPDADADIAIACITYLGFEAFAGGPCEGGAEFKKRLETHQLYKYAAVRWGDHARKASRLSPLAVDFLMSEGSVHASVQAMVDGTRYMGDLGQSTPEDPAMVTGLHVAAMFGLIEALDPLLKQQDLDAKDQSERTPLWYATANGHGEMVGSLLRKGAVLNSRDVYGRTPLSKAAQRGHKPMIGLLLESGTASAMDDDRYNCEQLFLASQCGFDTVVQILLKNGVDIESKDSEHRTPLSWAAEEGHPSIVGLLLKHGSNSGLGDRHGRTPFLWAAQKGNYGIVKMMIENGIELELKGSEYGQTTFTWAVVHNNMSVVELLLEHGAELNTEDHHGRTPLLWAALMGRHKMVKLLLGKNASLESRDSNGRTPLFWAAQKGHIAIVEMLLEAGADVECTDDEGRTALSWAVEKRHEDILELLLDRGADMETQNLKFGRTPLIWAAARGHVRTTEILLERGASMSATDPRGRTPLDWAHQNDHQAVVELFLAHETAQIEEIQE